MIPAGTVSMFVDGRMNSIISEEIRREEETCGSPRLWKRNILPTGSWQTGHGSVARTGARP
jgi:hypothetical protein